MPVWERTRSDWDSENQSGSRRDWLIEDSQESGMQTYLVGKCWRMEVWMMAGVCGRVVQMISAVSSCN